MSHPTLVGEIERLDIEDTPSPMSTQAIRFSGDAPLVYLDGEHGLYALRPDEALALATMLQGAAYEARTLLAVHRKESGEEAAAVAAAKGGAKKSAEAKPIPVRMIGDGSVGDGSDPFAGPTVERLRRAPKWP